MAVDIEHNNTRSDEDDYIGISRKCCAICHHVVHHHYGHQVQGTHGKYCNGDALIGLGLHPPDEQEEILRGLFPRLVINDEEMSEETNSDSSTENNMNHLNGTDTKLKDSFEDLGFGFNEDDFFPAGSDSDGMALQ